MIKIIPPEHFHTTRWKNGKGETRELAINDGGTLKDFDWRLSMARVAEDGAFSCFSGYLRHLILIKGGGIELQHDQSTTDRLDNPLDFATFDGGCQTVATLIKGPITDINLITKAGKYDVTVDTRMVRQPVTLRACTHCFIYCLDAKAILTSQDDSVNITLAAGHLMHLHQVDSEKLQINGKNMIVVHLVERT